MSNKGIEAAEAALEMVDLLAKLPRRRSTTGRTGCRPGKDADDYKAAEVHGEYVVFPPS